MIIIYVIAKNVFQGQVGSNRTNFVLFLREFAKRRFFKHNGFAVQRQIATFYLCIISVVNVFQNNRVRFRNGVVVRNALDSASAVRFIQRAIAYHFAVFVIHLSIEHSEEFLTHRVSRFTVYRRCIIMNAFVAVQEIENNRTVCVGGHNRIQGDIID